MNIENGGNIYAYYNFITSNNTFRKGIGKCNSIHQSLNYIPVRVKSSHRQVCYSGEVSFNRRFFFILVPRELKTKLLPVSAVVEFHSVIYLFIVMELFLHVESYSATVLVHIFNGFKREWSTVNWFSSVYLSAYLWHYIQNPGKFLRNTE